MTEFEDCYKNSKDALLGIAFNILGNEESAKEAVQDGLLRAWCNIDRFDKNKGSLGAWLTIYVKRASLDKRRAVRRHEGRLARLQEEPKEDRYYWDESEPDEIARVRDLVSSLSTKYRAAIELVYFENLMFKQTAEKLNIPVGSAKTRTARALKKLRSIWKSFKNDSRI